MAVETENLLQFKLHVLLKSENGQQKKPQTTIILLLESFHTQNTPEESQYPR